MHYTYISISVCILVGFYKIGDLDGEIGGALGLGTGMMVLAVNHFMPGSYLGLLLYCVGAFMFLTLYKMLRGLPKKKGHNPDKDIDARG